MSKTCQDYQKYLQIWTETYWKSILKIKEKYSINEEHFYRIISINPNITWDIIREHKNKPWDWYDIKYNPNITWDIIKDNPKELGKLWSMDNVYTKSNMSPKEIIDLNNLITDNMFSNTSNTPNFWKQISRNPNLTWDTIKEHKNKPWDWFYISFNPSVTWDIIKSNRYSLELV